MDKGDINAFIRKHQEVNRVQLVGFCICFYSAWYNRSLQLVDVALGLQYLHGFRFVHGDLKGVR